MNAQLLRKLVAMGLWMLFVGTALADGFCGLGAYDPNNGKAPAITCVPIRGYEQQAPQPPPQQWERRWGAIATGGALGVSTDKSSKQEASQTAMSNCKQQGGTYCKLDAVYDNACAAIVEGGGGYSTHTAVTADEAVARGMNVCRDAGGKDCHVYYSACSLPVRIR